MIIILLSFALLTCVIYLNYKVDNLNKIKMRQISKVIKSSFKEDLLTFDLPICLLKDDNIIWGNLVCKERLNKQDILEVYKTYIKNKKLKYIERIFDNNHYRVVISNINLDKEKVTLFIFVDKNKELELNNVLDNTRVTTGIISIDNYDETMQGVEELEKSLIKSDIDKVIKNWVTENNGIVINVDKDKYLIFIEKQYIEKMQNNKFEILKRIEALEYNTFFPITISIGLSNLEEKLTDRFEASNAALDIALGRGGNQVVIKKGKKFDFYGGTDSIIEKTSKVKARTVSSAICNVITKSEKIYIMSHKNTDLDCLGASIGIYKLCKFLNKDVKIIIDTKFDNGTKLMIEQFKSIEEYNKVFITKDNLKKVNESNYTLFILDTHVPSYTVSKDIINRASSKIVIDHHRRGSEYIQDVTLSYHELYASSTCELVSEILMYVSSLKLTKLEAEVLYSGILLDTKNYSFKTGVRTFEVSAYLRKCGIDINHVKRLFQTDFDSYIEKSEVIRNSEFIKDNIAIGICDEKDSNTISLTSEIADELLNINKVKACFVLCKIESVIMISARSNGDINVKEIMQKLGGGGHLTFAGAQLLNVNLLEAKEKLIEVINEEIS